MGVISLSSKNDDIWGVAGWAFRQILDDISGHYSGDTEMIREFETAKTLSGLHLDLISPDLAGRTRNAIKAITKGILSGQIRSGIHDKGYADTQIIEEYHESLRDLLRMVSAK